MTAPRYLCASSSLLLLITSFTALSGQNTVPVPGKVTEIEFPQPDMPPTLYSLVTGDRVPARMAIRLPDDYDPQSRYPLLVYFRGRDGGPSGDIGMAERIVGSRGWVLASVPLFKKSLDPSEPLGGIVLNYDDYPTLQKAYGIMLGRLFELVPNIEKDKGAMAGFSNGAITIGILVACQDPMVTAHFRSFVLVDQGASFLAGWYKKPVTSSRFLLLVGDRQDREGDGRELLMRQTKLTGDFGKFFGVPVEVQVMQGIGHAFTEEYAKAVGRWLKGRPFVEAAGSSGQ
ncbi:MAG: hypothetical protein EHM61_07575 [Acidobacteria bacterium]|nr:MAG: hypothetical protein EHM61_07575 [Acidobacteriota bacterium]